MKQNPMKDLVREAVLVSKELGDAIFVGAVAVYLHTGKTRESRDLDFAIASGLSKEQAIQKGGYTTHIENGKKVTRTPRMIKVDIYDQDVSDIPVAVIADTAKSVQVDSKGTTLKVACIEALIVSKHRASRPARPQDNADLYELAHEEFDEIDWKLLATMTKSQHEFDSIRVAMQAMRKIR